MRLKLETAGALPVSLAEAKTHLHVDSSDEDDVILRAINAAVERIDGPDGETGRAIAAQEWTMWLDGFPSGCIHLPFGPLLNVVSVAYVNSQGATVTLPEASWAAFPLSKDAALIEPLVPWPVPRAGRQSVMVRFRAGHEVVPDAIVSAILLIVGDAYLRRESGPVDEGTVKALLSKHTRPEI